MFAEGPEYGLSSAPRALEPTEGAPRASIGVLGPLTLQVRGNSVEPSAGRQRRLLSILAATASRTEALDTDELIEALYGESAPPTARRALTTELWRLRQLLGARAVVTEGRGYRLDLTRCALDSMIFEEQLAQSRTLLRDGGYDDAQRLLADALRLWRGTPLAEWADHPQGQAAALRLTELHLGAVEDHAEALAATDRHAEAITALEQLTDEEPTREHAWALLIESYLATGRRRQARRAFDTARRHLAEHGVEVGAELRTAWQRQNDAPPTHRPDPELIGRDRELAAVVHAVTGALRAAHPAAVVVLGEAGIGKSALAEAAARALGPDLDIARVHCDPRLDLPYGALLDGLAGHGIVRTPALERLHADPAPDVAGDRPEAVAAERLALRDAIASGIESAARAVDGLVLLVEDAHWAPAATLDVIAQVLARHASAPVCLLITIRDPVDTAPDRAPVLAELRRRADRVIGLNGLDETATGQLLGRAGDDPDTARRVHRETGGNPLYIRQVAGLALQVAGPAARRAGLDGALDEHLAALPADVGAVLELAAVAGDRCAQRALIAAAQALDVPSAQVDDALAVARSAGIVVGAEDVSFVHSLISDHLYRRVPAQRRARVHAAVADALRRTSIGQEPPLDLLAHHMYHAWPVCSAATAAEQQRAAGNRAAAQLDFVRAGEFYRRGLELIAMEQDAAERPAELTSLCAQLLVAAGQAFHAAGERAAARDAYTSLARLAQRHALPETLVRARLGLLRTSRDGRAEIDPLVVAVRSGVNSVSARPLAESIAAIYPHRPADGRELLDRAIATSPEAAARLRSTVWEQQDVADQLRTARALAADPDADRLGALLRLWVSEVAAGRRRLDAAPEQLAGAPGSEQSRWELALWRVTAAIGAGDFGRAERLIAAARVWLEHPSGPADAAARSAALLGQQAWLALLRGDTDTLAEASAGNPATWARRPDRVRIIGAYLNAVAGHHEVAGPAVEELVDELLDGTLPAGERLARTVILSGACIKLGNSRGIEACRDALAGHGEQHAVLPFLLYLGAVDHHLGGLAFAAGDLDEAITRLSSAAERHRAAGVPVCEAQSRHNLAIALWRRDRDGDRVAAAAERGRAFTLARRAGLKLGLIINREWSPT